MKEDVVSITLPRSQAEALGRLMSRVKDNQRADSLKARESGNTVTVAKYSIRYYRSNPI